MAAIGRAETAISAAIARAVVPSAATVREARAASRDVPADAAAITMTGQHWIGQHWITQMQSVPTVKSALTRRKPTENVRTGSARSRREIT